MRVFKTKVFSKFAKKESISDIALMEAVERAEKGLIDADLGGYVIKQRISREGQGRSSGYRVLIAARLKKRYIFLIGFAKNGKDNLSEDELKTTQEIAHSFIHAKLTQIDLAVKEGQLKEIQHAKKS